MKTKLINTVLLAFFSLGNLFAQDVTTVRANNSDISDNLDLQAVASIFGDSRDLEDFERRLNDPDMMISNLDLNGDNRVDYLRVIELTQSNTHVIVLQAVLGVDTFQDVATIDIERDRNNNVSVQVVGDTYMYGPNYIYEPVYVTRPALFGIFWVNTYRPYYSPWYWGYYPTYYNYWAPCPVYRYRNHVNVYVNNGNRYNYVNSRRNSRAANIYGSRRANAYERQHPNTSFSNRNQNVANRHELVQNRDNSVATRGGARGTVPANSRANSGATNSRSNGTRDLSQNTSGRGTFSNSSRNNSAATTRNNTATRATTAPRDNGNGLTRGTGNATRSLESSAPRATSTPTRSISTPARSESNPPARTISAPARQESAPVRNYSAPARQESAPARSISAPVRQQQSAPAMRSSAPSAPRQSAPSAPRSNGGGGGRSSRG